MGVPVQIVAAVLALALAAAVLTLTLRSRAAARREVALAHAENAELRLRLATFERDLAEMSRTVAEHHSAYLITDAGTEPVMPNVPDRVVLSATFGEPLVKVVAFGHGLARALSPESRNRIWFEMRREVRRARKQRRRETKEAWRQMRADERSAA